LLLRKLLKDQFIDLHDFDFTQNKPSFSIIHDLISGKAKTKLCDLADSRDESVNLLSKRLRRLSRKEKLLFEEHGSKDLYVGWPFLAGKFSDGTPVRCPLMFFPVEIEMTDKGWVLRQREDVNITLNKVFLIAYGHYNDVKISEELLERVFEDFDTDSMVFRTGLYHLFKESPVEINFNQDNFIDKLERFKEYNKQEFDEAQKTGSIKLFPEAVLGIFPQSGSYLVPDYEFIGEDQSFSDLAEFFEARLPQEIPGDRYGFLSKVKEEETYTPFKMDAYQENAIKAIKKGMSVVIQGPPGTGKSQVICNLISDYIARGKKVLVVCQKRAALDVVYERFEDLELSDFLGLIHDFKNDRKELYQKIDKQIKNIEQYKLSINSLDALQLERQFQQCSRKIDQITEELEELKTALYDEQEAGISVKELYLTSNLAGDGINLKQEYKNFNFHLIQDNFSRIRNYLAYLMKFGKPDYPLLDRQSFAGYTIAALRRMQEQLAEINDIHEEIATTTTEIAGSEITLEDCRTILDKKELTKEFLSLITNDSIYEQLKNLMRIKSGEEHQQWFTTHSSVLLDALSGEGIESTLEKEEIGSFQKALHAAIVARTNFFKFLHWKLFNKDRAWVIAIIEKNKLSVDRAGLKSLIAKVDNRLNLEHNLTLIHEKGWLEPFRGKLTYKAIGQWVSEINKAFRAKAIFSSLRNFSEYFAVQQLTAKQLD
jgi:DNA polymerase IIIc chi subunit